MKPASAARPLLAVCAALLAACLFDDASHVRSLALGEDAAFFAEDVADPVEAAPPKSAEDGEEGEEEEEDCVPPRGEGAERWRRERRRTGDAEVAVSVQDGLALVSRSSELEGRLLIDLDGACPVGAKPMHEVALRSALYAKAREGRGGKSLDALAAEPGRPAGARRGWRLVGVSPVEFRLFPDDAHLQYVEIGRVAAYAGGEARFDIDDPAKVLRFGEGFATFAPGETVRVEAEVSNAGQDGRPRPSRVFLHREGRRVEMRDDGTGGDLEAEDGVFSAEFAVGKRRGLRHLAVDALDAAVLADETSDNYDSNAWGVPYLVRPAEEDSGGGS